MEILRSFKKKALRPYYKHLRASLDRENLIKMNQQIMTQFLKLPIRDKNFKYALSYLPITMTNEVDTAPFNHYLLHYVEPSIQVAFPRTNFRTLEMEAVLPDQEARFTQKWLKLMEPDEGLILDPRQIDLVLMPLLIFDVKGNRVGYGKGFYDRYLSKCRQDILKIGLSYLPAINRIEDVDPFDIPLDYCATPERLYDFT